MRAGRDPGRVGEVAAAEDRWLVARRDADEPRDPVVARNDPQRPAGLPRPDVGQSIGDRRLRPGHAHGCSGTPGARGNDSGVRRRHDDDHARCRDGDAAQRGAAEAVAGERDSQHARKVEHRAAPGRLEVGARNTRRDDSDRQRPERHRQQICECARGDRGRGRSGRRAGGRRAPWANKAGNGEHGHEPDEVQRHAQQEKRHATDARLRTALGRILEGQKIVRDEPDRERRGGGQRIPPGRSMGRAWRGTAARARPTGSTPPASRSAARW